MRKSEFQKSAALKACAAPLATAMLLAAAPAAIAAPAGPLRVLEAGLYSCEGPGQALGAASLHIPAEDFRIVHTSSYEVGLERGTYLLIGDIATMTSGPKRGQRFHRISTNFLRKLRDDGSDSELRCVRSVPNTG